MPTSFELTGTPDEIIAAVKVDHPDLDGVLARARANVPFIKREILPHEAAVLYALARGYDRAGANIMEIGTAWGYSAAVMAEAAPRACITTLNPKLAEFERAVQHLVGYANVTPLLIHSWDYLDLHHDDGVGLVTYDMVFVDGSHEQVARDLPWWDRLRPGGLLLFHDYSPDGSGRPCREVYQAVNEWRATEGLEPGVLVTDDRNIGMIGFIKSPEPVET